MNERYIIYESDKPGGPSTGGQALVAHGSAAGDPVAGKLAILIAGRERHPGSQLFSASDGPPA